MKYAIYGTGYYAKKFIDDVLLNHGGGVYCFVESIPHLHVFRGKKVVTPAELPDNIDLIIVISTYIEDIKHSLNDAHIDTRKCVFSYNARQFECTDDKNISKLLELVKEEFLSEITISIDRSKDSYSLIRTVEGLYFASRLRDDMIEDMKETGKVYSREQIDAFFKLCKEFYPNIKGNTLLDCGCNILTTSVYALSRNSDIRSLAFEPVPDVYEKAVLNARLNDITTRCTLVNAALSNKCSTMKMKRFEYSSGIGFLLNDNQKKDLTNTIDVDVYSLDEWCHANKFDTRSIGYLWVDVQGHEGFLLDGAREVLSKKPPLFLEYYTNALDETGDWDLLISVLEEFYSEFIIIGEKGNFDMNKRESVKALEKKEHIESNIFLIS